MLKQKLNIMTAGCLLILALSCFSYGAGTGPRMMDIALADLEDGLPPPGSPFILEIQVAEREAMGESSSEAGEESATPMQRSQQIAAAAQSAIDSANAGIAFASSAAGPPGAGGVSISPAFDDRNTMVVQQTIAAERAAAVAAAAASAASERAAAASAASAAAAAAQQHAAQLAAAASATPSSDPTPAAAVPATTPTPAVTPTPTPTPAAPTAPTPAAPTPVTPTPVTPEPVDPNPVDPNTQGGGDQPPEDEQECPSDEPCEGVLLEFATVAKPTEIVASGKSLFLRASRSSKSAINLRDQKYLDRICLELFRAGKNLPPECRDHIHSHPHK